MTHTSSHIVEKIEQAKSSGIKKLDLSNEGFFRREEGLTEIPPEVFEIGDLESLDLRRNSIRHVDTEIGKLGNLKSLGLSSNRLTDLPDSIGELEKLVSLDLSVNELFTLPTAIAKLINLTSLDLSFNRLLAIPESVYQLKNLEALDLSVNRLSTISETISDLQNLKLLRLPNNSFSHMPEAIYELANLHLLDLRNVSSDLVIPRYDPGNMTYDMHRNQIREISPKILNLRCLNFLGLDGNPIEIPPPEVASKGINAIRNYFTQLEAQGKDYLFEAKLLIVGEGGAGKTTLANKLQNSEYQLRDELSTKGIEVLPWTFALKDERPFRVNIWDFGGQEIYHSTHQFFLTKRSLYVLVADTRREDTDFFYWLNAVELLSENSPIIIVKNEKQDRKREISERQLRGQFSNLKETFATNLATNRGLSPLADEIKHQISHLPHVGTPLPKTWVKVRDALEKDPRNHIRLDEFLRICEENGFTELKDKLQLSGYLHDLGVCLHFQDDPLLKKTVILKPRWGTDAVYKILDNKRVIDNLGQFKKTDLADIWYDPKYADMQDELLQLMIKFKLCYQIPDSDFYIAPQLLTENQPYYVWDESDNLILRYTYEFMPKGILTQVIVGMHKLIQDQKYVWRSGVVLLRDRTRAEVIEYYGKREVKIRVTGKHRKELLTLVSYVLDQIHNSYKRLKYVRLIPCTCSSCKNTQNPHFFSLEVLRKFVEDRQERIQCQVSYEMVNARGLIDDIWIPQPGDRTSDNLMPYDLRDRTASGIWSRDVVSAWANGSFYLFAFAIVIAGLAVLARTVSPYVLGGLVVASIIIVPLIGALQLRQDNRLSEKSFLELMKLVVGQLPLIGKLFREEPTAPKSLR